MPSALPLPTIAQLRSDAASALTGQEDIYADARDGAIYDHLSGPTSILFARESDRDKSMFEDCYFDSATGWALTKRGLAIYGTQRVLDSFGTGQCTFARSSASGGGGTFWQGTRVQVAGSPAVEYQIAIDTPVGSVLSATVPIKALLTGPGSAVSTTQGLSLEDPLYDPLWGPVQITCSDGTMIEKADAYRARSRAASQLQISGQLATILATLSSPPALAYPALASVGALSFLGIPSTYNSQILQPNFAFFGSFDCGLNAIYLWSGVQSLSAAALIQATQLLETVRVLGNDLWVGTTVSTPVTVQAYVNLTAPPGQVPLVTVTRQVVSSLLSFFGNGPVIGYSRQQLEAVMVQSSPYVQGAHICIAPPAMFAGVGFGTLSQTTGTFAVNVQCSNAGLAGGSALNLTVGTQPGVGTTIVDGSVVWTVLGSPQLAPVTFPSKVTPNTLPATMPLYTLSPYAVQLQWAGPL